MNDEIGSWLFLWYDIENGRGQVEFQGMRRSQALALWMDAHPKVESYSLYKLVYTASCP